MFSNHGMPPPPPPPLPPGGDGNNSMSGILAVAERIRERALHLVQEQTIEQEAKAEVDRLESMLLQAQAEHQRQRQRLLEARTGCDGVELEYGRLVEQREERQRKSDKIQQDIRDIEAQIEALQKTWDETVDGIFSAHRIQRELYTNILEQHICSVEQAKKQRQDRLQLLMDKTEQMKQEKESKKAQMICIQQQLLPQAKSDREETDHHVHQLALQVRTALTKRTELRSALREAQKECKQANENMVHAEAECLQNSAGASTRER